MKSCIWIGNPFFSNKLSQMGWEKVYVHTFVDFQLFTYADLVRLAGFEPDVVVVADKSMPPFVLGVEHFPCLTALYVVDSHVHSWFPLYAQAFDCCLVSLFDHCSSFVSERLPKERILWSPPYAQDAYRPKGACDPVWDCLFVGTVSANTPKRAQFLAELGRILPNLYVTTGPFVELYPKAKVVLNFCEFGDLNFRVFEAMGLGAALVTPRIAQHQDSLFTDAFHYVLYDAQSPANAKSAILRLLHDEMLRRQIQNNALAIIDQKHRASHRAKAFTEHIASLWDARDQIIAERIAQAPWIREHSLRLLYCLWAKEMEDASIQQTYLAYAKGLIW
ncbi:MAG: glycosyltransferase family 1 protein [Desulfovibrio sp.]|nr:glycosyltransferase family 1 protein [Desulfovibrio sp.]